MLIHDIVKIGEFIGPTLKGKNYETKNLRNARKHLNVFMHFLAYLYTF